MEKITFIHTVSCSECKGKHYPERYNDPQSPCYHCGSITATTHEGNAVKTLEGRIIDKQKRNFKIMELRTSGKSYGEIARAMDIPRATVQSVVKKHEQQKAPTLPPAVRR